MNGDLLVRNRQRVRSVDLRLLRRIIRTLLTEFLKPTSGKVIRSKRQVVSAACCSPHPARANHLPSSDKGRGQGEGSAFASRHSTSIEPLPHFELCLYLVAAPEMTRLNRGFLHHEGSTDVITFNYADPAHVESINGEIFICLDDAVAQARQFRTTWQSELVRYVIHGVLHLRGYDDQQPAARKIMKREEERLLRKISRRFPLSKLGQAPKLAA